MTAYELTIVHHGDGGHVATGGVRYASRANAREAMHWYAKIKFPGATSHPSGSPDARLVKREGEILATVAVERAEDV